MFEIFLCYFCILGCSGRFRRVLAGQGVSRGVRRCSLGVAECSGDLPELFQVLQAFVTGTFFPMKSETMDNNRWNILETTNMLASTLIKMVNPANEKPEILILSDTCRLYSTFPRRLVYYNIPLAGCLKAYWLKVIDPQDTKNCSCACATCGLKIRNSIGF